MNALTPHAEARTMQSVRPSGEPSLSRSLALDLERMTDPDPAARALRHFDPHAFTPAQRAEASWAAERYRELMAPVTRAQLVAWLGAVNAACRNPQDPEDFQVRISAIGQDCAHLPGACFMQESRRALYGETRFFPSAGDVLAVLEPLAKRLQGKLAALERIAAEPVGPGVTHEGKRVAPSAEVVAEVGAKLSALRQELAAKREDLPAGSEGRAVTPRHLSPAALAEGYRAQVARGGPFAQAAQERLKRLLQESKAGAINEGRGGV